MLGRGHGFLPMDGLTERLWDTAYGAAPSTQEATAVPVSRGVRIYEEIARWGGTGTQI